MNRKLVTKKNRAVFNFCGINSQWLVTVSGADSLQMSDETVDEAIPPMQKMLLRIFTKDLKDLTKNLNFTEARYPLVTYKMLLLF